MFVTDFDRIINRLDPCSVIVDRQQEWIFQSTNFNSSFGDCRVNNAHVLIATRHNITTIWLLSFRLNILNTHIILPCPHNKLWILATIGKVSSICVHRSTAVIKVLLTCKLIHWTFSWILRCFRCCFFFGSIASWIARCWIWTALTFTCVVLAFNLLLELQLEI